MAVPAFHGLAGPSSIAVPVRVGEAIDGMLSGRVRLRAPVHRGVIQVGAQVARPTFTMVVVTRTPSTMTIRRADDVPLQAEIIRRGPWIPETRTAVFLEPVDQLTIRRTGIGEWAIADAQRVRCSEDLAQLIATVVSFATAKQRGADSN